MRISDRQRYEITNARVDKAKDDNATMLEELATQKRINRVSDDPLGMAQALKRKTQISSMEQYGKNIDFAKGFIDRTENSLTGIHDYLIRAKELAVSLANDTYGETSREAAGLEVKQIIEGIVALGNSQYGNRYVFGGFRSQTPPISGDGQFTGDDGAIFLAIDNGTFRQINLQARGLFEPSPDDRAQKQFGMIATLEMLEDGLSSNNMDSIRKAMDGLDYQMDKSSSYQATLGSIYNAIEETGKRVELSKELSQEDLSNIEDSDVYRATSDFKKTETVLQSTLLASNKLLQPSLLNFLQ